jgi:hypothetical protein
MLRQVLVVHRRQEKLGHRKHPARSLDHRRRLAVGSAKNAANDPGIERGRGNHQLEIPALFQQPLEIS